MNLSEKVFGVIAALKLGGKRLKAIKLVFVEDEPGAEAKTPDAHAPHSEVDVLQHYWGSGAGANIEFRVTIMPKDKRTISEIVDDVEELMVQPYYQQQYIQQQAQMHQMQGYMQQQQLAMQAGLAQTSVAIYGSSDGGYSGGGAGSALAAQSESAHNPALSDELKRLWKKLTT